MLVHGSRCLFQRILRTYLSVCLNYECRDSCLGMFYSVSRGSHPAHIPEFVFKEIAECVVYSLNFKLYALLRLIEDSDFHKTTCLFRRAIALSLYIFRLFTCRVDCLVFPLFALAGACPVSFSSSSGQSKALNTLIFSFAVMRFYFERHTRKIRSMKVSRLMTNRTLITVKKSDSIPRLLSLFEKHKVSDFPVVDDEGNLVGDVDLRDILPFALDPEDVSEHEIVGVLGTELHDIFGNKVEDIMKFHEETVSPDDKLKDVALLMWKGDIRCVAVVKNNKVVGVISQRDIIDLLFKVLKETK
ncbi:CBS domain-containing protein [Candidatus Woesearchaeota archaeon]|nr:MAG: CBS domain-containing protein [Candidatus Woesearchaeota archaeon]